MPQKKVASDSGWVEISGMWSQQDLWVVPTGPTKTPVGQRWETEDGEWVYEVIGQGEGHRLPFETWFARDTGGRDKRRGDMLWCSGLPISVVSERLVETLPTLGVTDFSTYEVDLRDLKGAPIPGYVGLLASTQRTETSELLAGPYRVGKHGSWIYATVRVLQGLVDAGAGLVRWSPAGPGPSLRGLD